MDDDFNLTLDQFCAHVVKDIRKYLPDEYKEYQVTCEEVVKSSGRQKALIIKDPNLNTAPAIYLNAYYGLCLTGQSSLEDVMTEIAHKRIDLTREVSGLPFYSKAGAASLADVVRNWDKARERVIAGTAGCTLNKEIVETRPHTLMGGDLAVIYKIDLGSYSGESYSVPVSYGMLSEWGVSIELLHAQAMDNVKRTDPVVIKDMNDFISEMTGMPIAYMPIDGPSITILTSDRNNNVSLFFPDVLRKLEEMYPEGAYIIPSSNQDFLILRKDDVLEDMDLNRMIEEVNMACVEPDERLSDYVHEYDPKTHTISAPGMQEPRVKRIEGNLNFAPQVARAFGLTGADAETSEERKEPSMKDMAAMSQEKGEEEIKKARRKRTGR